MRLMQVHEHCAGTIASVDRDVHVHVNVSIYTVQTSYYCMLLYSKQLRIYKCSI